MSITLTIENSHRTFFVIAIRIAGIKCVNRGSESLEFRLICIDAVVVVFAAIRVFGIEILVGFAPC